MKKIITILSFLVFSTSVFAQTESMENFNDAFANPTNLNDKQMNDANKFIHQGVKDKAYKEGCAKLNDCQDQQGLPLEEMIGKAYTMLGMFMGGGMVPKIDMKPNEQQLAASETSYRQANNIPEGTQLNPEQTTAAHKNAQGDEKTDWCQAIAMANETIGGMIQSHMQQKAQQKAQAELPQGDTQLSTLVQLKESHKARRKTANWQSAAYGTITACYGAMIIKGGAVKDPWKLYVKMGGAALLTGLYIKKADKHKKAMGKVDEVIASLPKEGACNPYTKTSCFCAEKTSKELYPQYYQEVCVMNGGNFDEPKFAVGCGTMVNGKLNYDKDCKCKQNNSCIPPKFGNIGGAFDFGSNLMGTPDDMLKVLNGGEFDEGRLRDYSTGMAAMAKRMKPKKIGGKIPKLTPEQEKIAAALGDVLPRELAAIAAASPASGNMAKNEGAGADVSKLPPEMKEKLAEAISGNYKMGGGGSNYVASDDPEFTMPKLPGQEESSSSTEVVSFAEQAISKADVSNAPSTPIFDIISNRYRRSGWQKLQTLQE